jgi:hypothetical protein
MVPRKMAVSGMMLPTVPAWTAPHSDDAELHRVLLAADDALHVVDEVRGDYGSWTLHGHAIHDSERHARQRLLRRVSGLDLLSSASRPRRRLLFGR